LSGESTLKSQRLSEFRNCRCFACATMDPAAAYEILIGTVRGRLLILDVDVNDESVLNRAERFALHVRKIVEAVSFAALSATNTHILI
jgi:hypothetical protein